MKRRSSIAKFISLLGCLVVVLASGCWYENYSEYEGEYPALFTVAINNLLGIKGFFLSEMTQDPRICIIEEDSYERVLFAYSEYSEISKISLMIMQKEGNDKVYFYPDYSFISCGSSTQEYMWNDRLAEKVTESFSNEKILALKEKNDWDKPINESKCKNAAIVRKKQQGPLSFSQIKGLYETAVGLENAYSDDRNVQYFISDDYGRSIYAVSGKYTEQTEKRCFAVLIFNPDGSYNEETSVMKLTDIYNYQDQLKAFKTQNNWNLPV